MYNIPRQASTKKNNQQGIGMILTKVLTNSYQIQAKNLEGSTKDSAALKTNTCY